MHMLTNAEIRRIKLNTLIERFGSVAALNHALGWDRTDTRLGRIKNKTARGDRGPEKTYNMGDAMAREIEQALGLEEGYLDNLEVEAGDRLTADESYVLAGFRVATDEIKAAILAIAGQALNLKKPNNGHMGSQSEAA